MAALDHFPLPLDGTDLERVVQDAKDWAIVNGVSMRSKSSFSLDGVIIAPFTLFPSPFPQVEFNKAIRLQTTMNQLIHCVANDSEFLKKTLMKASEGDDFIRQLYQVYEEVLKFPNRQRLSLGLLRTDYMCDLGTGIKQVETNTIASSFSSLSCKVGSLHRTTLCSLGYEDLTKHMPTNRAVQNLVKGMLEACHHHSNPNGAILAVVEDITMNISDQRLMELLVKEIEPKRMFLRRTFKELRTLANLGPKGELLVGNQEVSLVYFRCGYLPDHFEGNIDYQVLLTLEKSMAIKCPSIEYHLAGTKKVQQALSEPGVIEKFIKNPTELISTFVGMYSLDPGTDGDQNMLKATEDPSRYVLKPQREGGGNNMYSNDIPKALSKMSDRERGGWILMDLIKPAPFENYVIRANEPTAKQWVTSELGIYGVIIGDNESILYNEVAGHVLRTKSVDTNEAGINSGGGSLDSPLLTIK